MMCSLWGSYQHAIVGLHNMERNISYISSVVSKFFMLLFISLEHLLLSPSVWALCLLLMGFSACSALSLTPTAQNDLLIILLPSLGLRFVGKENSVFPWIIWLHYFHCQGSVRFFCSLVHSLQDEWYMGFSYLMTDNLDKAPLLYCLSH